MKILVIFPTNIGDTILALPVIDRLKANYPLSKIFAISSPRTHNFLSKNIFLEDVILFDKQWNALAKLNFCLSLRKAFVKFDIIVDLKNSLLPIILPTKKRTNFFRFFDKNLHQKDRYLKLVEKLAPKTTNLKSEFKVENNFKFKSKAYIFVCCSSRSSIKVYPKELLKEVIKKIRNIFPVVILGEDIDKEYYAEVLKEDGIIDLVGKTSLAEVFFILKNYAKILMCVDSSILHLASYIDLPIVALFGPTDDMVYGPWSSKYLVLKRTDLECRPCKSSKCNNYNQCMRIPPDEIVKAIEQLL